MPARRLLMRKIREILRLKHERGLSHRAIAQACAIGVGTVSLYLQRTTQQGLGWPLPAGAGRRGARSPLVPPCRAGARAGPARLRAHPPRAQAGRRHAAAPLGGVRPGPSERLPLHPVLRDLPGSGNMKRTPHHLARPSLSLGACLPRARSTAAVNPAPCPMRSEPEGRIDSNVR